MASAPSLLTKKKEKSDPVRTIGTSMNIPSRMPIPYPWLQNCCQFTKLDICWGYNNVRIWDGDQWKAAFKTNKGLYEPTVMFSGLCNSPATFQAMIDKIFADMIDENFIIVYMDNISLFAPDKITLVENTKRVLNDLFKKKSEIWMVRKMSKSNWWLKEMVYWITGLNDARSNMAIPNWNRCIEICNRSSPHSVRLEWWQTLNIIHIENLFTSRMKLKSMIVNYCQLFRHWGLAKFFCGYHYLNLVLWVNSPSDFYD